MSDGSEDQAHDEEQSEGQEVKFQVGAMVLAYYSLPPRGRYKAKVVRVLQEDYIVEWADGATSGRRVPHDKVEPLEYEA